MRRTVIIAMIAVPAVARAQFVTSGPNRDERAGENVKETAIRGRVTTTGFYYAESSDATPGVSGAATDPASDQSLLYTDLRGRIEAAHIQGSKWDAVGDFRLRLPADDLAARGQLGGAESDLREAFVTRRGAAVDVSLGRIIVREVDAQTIDGVRVGWRASPRFEAGAFAGFYPNPLSRSLGADYRDGVAPQDLPVAAGGWGGYRFAKAWGNVGLAGVAPRDPSDVDPEPSRAFVTANGYWRVAQGVDLFHYLVADLAGPEGATLMNAQLGGHWRVSPALVLEAGASHMSTYAIELYVKDYLEQAEVVTPGRVQNNIFVARMASDELRAGATYLFRDARVNVFGQLRWRKRANVAPGDLPMDLAGLTPDTQVEFSGGVRQRRSVAGLDLSLTGFAIAGDRTDTVAVTARASRSFRDEKFLVEADATYLSYDDACDASGADPTCTGTASGTSFELGATFLYRHSRRWLFLADYHHTTNSATSTIAGITAGEPTITAHSLFARVQYSF